MQKHQQRLITKCLCSFAYGALRSNEFIIRRIESLKAIPHIATDVTVAWSVRLYRSVTLMHPAKAVGRNEMPFGRDTRVVPSNIALDRYPPPREGETWGRSDRCRLSSNYFALVIIAISRLHQCDGRHTHRWTDHAVATVTL